MSFVNDLSSHSRWHFYFRFLPFGPSNRIFLEGGGEGLKIQKRQLIRNDIVALYFPFSEYPFFTLQKLRFKRLKGNFRSAKLPF